MNKADNIYYKPKIAILATSNYFKNYSDNLFRAFKNKNFECIQLEQIDSYDFDCLLVIGPHQHRKLNFLKLYYKQIVTIAIWTEQHSTPHLGAENFSMYRKKEFDTVCNLYDFVFDWNKGAVDFLKNTYENVIWLPHSHSPNLSTTSKSTCTTKEYDLVFIGDTLSNFGGPNRRNAILMELGKIFKVYPFSTNLWGENLLKAYKKSKIALNIHFEYSLSFESPRFYEILGLKETLLLSEPVLDSSPFEAGKDYVCGVVSEWPDLVSYYLENTAEREGIILSGYEKCISMKLGNVCDTILKFIFLEFNRLQSKKYRLKKIIKKTRPYHI